MTTASLAHTSWNGRAMGNQVVEDLAVLARKERVLDAVVADPAEEPIGSEASRDAESGWIFVEMMLP